MSPGMEAVMTDSGTRESEQPIQSTCVWGKGRWNVMLCARSADNHLGRLALRALLEEARLDLGDVVRPLRVRGQYARQGWERRVRHIAAR